MRIRSFLFMHFASRGATHNSLLPTRRQARGIGFVKKEILRTLGWWEPQGISPHSGSQKSLVKTASGSEIGEKVLKVVILGVLSPSESIGCVSCLTKSTEPLLSKVSAVADVPLICVASFGAAPADDELPLPSLTEGARAIIPADITMTFALAPPVSVN